MSKRSYTTDELRKCHVAVAARNPAVVGALQLVASARCQIELSEDGRLIWVTHLDKTELPKKRQLQGGWALFRAGMVDAFGCVTQAGKAFLASCDMKMGPVHQFSGQQKAATPGAFEP